MSFAKQKCQTETLLRGKAQSKMLVATIQGGHLNIPQTYLDFMDVTL